MLKHSGGFSVILQVLLRYFAPYCRLVLALMRNSFGCIESRKLYFLEQHAIQKMLWKSVRSLEWKFRRERHVRSSCQNSFVGSPCPLDNVGHGDVGLYCWLLLLLGRRRTVLLSASKTSYRVPRTDRLPSSGSVGRTRNCRAVDGGRGRYLPSTTGRRLSPPSVRACTFDKDRQSSSVAELHGDVGQPRGSRSDVRWCRWTVSQRCRHLGPLNYAYCHRWSALLRLLSCWTAGRPTFLVLSDRPSLPQPEWPYNVWRSSPSPDAQLLYREFSPD